MSLIYKNFDDISESDLDGLIIAAVPEGLAIEYKSALYGKRDDDKKEFLKDLSSLANTVGGHLIIGMQEVGGIASAIVPLLVDTDLELQRLESLARDGLEPRIVGLRMKSIAMGHGAAVIVVRVPKSWNPPHRVKAGGSNRMFARTSAGAYELSVEELRVIFTRGVDAADRARAFRSERLSKISADAAAAPLFQSKSYLVLHIVPASAISSNETVDIERAYRHRDKLRPILADAMTARFNFDGIINARGGSPTHGYAQLFRSGAIEAVHSGLIAERAPDRLIPGTKFGDAIAKSLPPYMQLLEELGVSPPVLVMITILGTKGAMLMVGGNSYDDPPPLITHETLELPIVTVEDYGSEDHYYSRLQFAFDALWNAADLPSSNYFQLKKR